MPEGPSIARRDLLVGAGALAGGMILGNAGGVAAERSAIKAVAFDAFPIFDPRPVFKAAAALSPDHGDEFVKLWRERQFEYTWLRALSGRYADFWQTTQDALDYAAAALKIGLDDAARARLMSAYLDLKAWPDVPEALLKLKGAGVGLALLSNFTPAMLEANLKSAGLEGVFAHVLSTDAVKSYKPDPRAYELGVDAFRLPRESILFVPFAAWDAAGAKAFGYPTFWVNRLNQPLEQLGETPDGTGAGLNDLVKFLGI